MAEAGLIIAIIQIATQGLTLSQKLNNFVGRTRDAPQTIRSITSDVQATSRTLKELAECLDSHDGSDLANEQWKNSTRGHLETCDLIFGEIGAIIDGDVHEISKSQRIKVAFKHTEMKRWEGKLVSLKNDFNFKISVLNLARHEAERRAEASRLKEKAKLELMEFEKEKLSLRIAYEKMRMTERQAGIMPNLQGKHPEHYTAMADTTSRATNVASKSSDFLDENVTENIESSLEGLSQLWASTKRSKTPEPPETTSKPSMVNDKPIKARTTLAETMQEWPFSMTPQSIVDNIVAASSSQPGVSDIVASQEASSIQPRGLVDTGASTVNSNQRHSDRNERDDVNHGNTNVDSVDPDTHASAPTEAAEHPPASAPVHLEASHASSPSVATNGLDHAPELSIKPSSSVISPTGPARPITNFGKRARLGFWINSKLTGIDIDVLMTTTMNEENDPHHEVWYLQKRSRKGIFRGAKSTWIKFQVDKDRLEEMIMYHTRKSVWEDLNLLTLAQKKRIDDLVRARNENEKRKGNARAYHWYLHDFNSHTKNVENESIVNLAVVLTRRRTAVEDLGFDCFEVSPLPETIARIQKKSVNATSPKENPKNVNIIPQTASDPFSYSGSMERDRLLDWDKVWETARVPEDVPLGRRSLPPVAPSKPAKRDSKVAFTNSQSHTSQPGLSEDTGYLFHGHDGQTSASRQPEAENHHPTPRRSTNATTSRRHSYERHRQTGISTPVEVQSSNRSLHADHRVHLFPAGQSHTSLEVNGSDTWSISSHDHESYMYPPVVPRPRHDLPLQGNVAKAITFPSTAGDLSVDQMLQKWTNLEINADTVKARDRRRKRRDKAEQLKQKGYVSPAEDNAP